MDRGGSLRFILLGIAGVFLWMALQKYMGGDKAARQPLGGESHVVASTRAPEATCDLWTPTFHAELRTHGGTLTHFQLLTAKYAKKGVPLDLSTTPDPAGEHEFRQQLFTKFRGDGPPDSNAPWNVDFDSIDYRLARSDGKTCEFVYKDDKVEIDRTVKVTGRPYELAVENTIKNLASKPMRHEVSVDTVAWRTNHETEGKMFRISPYVTHVECLPEAAKAVRLRPNDFEPKEFKTEAFARSALNPNGDWHVVPGTPEFAAVSNAYFSQALVPESAPVSPSCLLQIEQRWDYTRYDSPAKDENAGAMYRARLAYPPKVLGPNESARYDVLSYVGPKERDVLAEAAGGKHHLTDLIDLGFFSSIAKILVAFLLKVHGVIPNWGIAIIVLTITARVLLFPLSFPGIQNMVRMREIKPEMDALNEKYKDDPQARGLAQMELWRKHKVNPFKGCLPQLASMPVWFALYTTLQTAVELYNIPFLWFPDLSQSDPYFVLPFIIGGTYFVQQRITPMQGGDPVQQKMMAYMMPIMFTVFMLFLPAGLGVYMFTNSVLAITQQWSVERYTKRTLGAKTAGQIGVRDKGGSTPPSSGGGQRKKKNQKRDATEKDEVAKNRPLLDEGDHEHERAE
jgi:YidC/Oxa1 family membrane protein insertase